MRTGPCSVVREWCAPQRLASAFRRERAAARTSSMGRISAEHEPSAESVYSFTRLIDAASLSVPSLVSRSRGEEG